MKRLLLALFVLALGLANASAEEFTYTFGTTGAEGWTVAPLPFGADMTDGTGRGMQYNASTAKSATLTLKGAQGVEKVVVTCSANIADKNSIEVLVGGTSLGTEVLASEKNVEKTFTASPAASGDLVLNLTIGQKSLYIKQVVVTAAAIEASADSTDADAGLDPDYTYAEPTALLPTGDTGNNAAYTFTQNNVKVDVSTGGESKNYFGVNAGKTITFTAARPIKGIAIKGYLKADFTATTSAGTITYSDGEGYEMDGSPVVLVKDIDSKTVTLTTSKQMRIFQADLYFDANPTATLATPDDMYSYALEPTTATTQEVTFQNISPADIYDSYGYTQLYFYNDYTDLVLSVYAPYDANTYIAPGTYKVDWSGDEGTIGYSYGRYTYYDASKDQFSVYDYDAVLNQYDASYNATPYYITDGTLTVAYADNLLTMTFEGESYNYSTIKATYSETITPTAIADAKAQTAAKAVRKLIKNGRLVIEREGRTYNASGAQLR